MPYNPVHRGSLVRFSSIYAHPWLNDVRFRPIIFEHLSALLSASTHYSVLLIERAVVALLRLALILAQKVSMCPIDPLLMPTHPYPKRRMLYAINSIYHSI